MKYCPRCGRPLDLTRVDTSERLRCADTQCGYVFWDNPKPVVAAIVEHEDRVVLTRKKNWPAKMFGLVSGFLERGETAETGVLREVEEELGVRGEIVDFVGYYSFFEMNELLLVFHVKAQGRMIKGDELAEIKRIEVNRLRPWTFGTGLAVRDWLAGRQGSADSNGDG